MRPVRRGLLVLAVVVSSLAGLSGTASAGVQSTKGSPQPEMAPFVISAHGGGPAEVAIGPDNTFDIVYTLGEDYHLCVLARAARSCKSTALLTPEGGSSIFGNPQVFVVGSDVDVVMDECCAVENDLIFQSTDGGKTFAAPERIGITAQQGIASAAVANGNLVWVDGSGAIVDSASLSDPGAAEQTSASVVPNGSGNNELENSGIGAYKGGVLVAASTFANVPSTKVYYAPKGSDPGSISSYGEVGTFSNARFAVPEGNALITREQTGSTPFEIRLFNGSSFGPEHVVPSSGGGGPQWFGAAVSSSGRVFFFSERNQDSYDLYIESTSNGATWTTRRDYGSAVTSGNFNGALDSIGSGIVVASSNPIRVYPVLVAQSVSFTLSKYTIPAGASVTARGASDYPKAGRKVEIQYLDAGLWHNLLGTTESASGRFSVAISGLASGVHTLRAVAADELGYVQIGYSASKVLKVN